MNHAHRVLIIDPFDEAEMYAIALRRLQVSVQIASSGRDGLAAFEDHRPDTVVIALHLQGSVDVVRSLKRQRPAPLVVVLSAHLYEPVLSPMIDAGCDAIQMTPCLPYSLIGRLQDLSARRSTASEDRMTVTERETTRRARSNQSR